VSFGERVLWSNVIQLSTGQPVTFGVPFRPGTRAPWAFAFKFEYMPFCELQKMPEDAGFLSSLLLAFLTLAPSDLTRYSESWPLLCWLRQIMTTRDATIAELYETILPDRRYDLAVLRKGVRARQSPVPRYAVSGGREEIVAGLTRALLYPDRLGCEPDGIGLSSTEFFDLCQTIAQKIAAELGVTVDVFPSRPSHAQRLTRLPELLAFVPLIDDTGFTMGELFLNATLYQLHGFVREVEGVYSASVYSPCTRHFYDIHAGNVTLVERQPPPLWHSREQMLFMLYVRSDWSHFFGRYAPIRGFTPRYTQIEVWTITVDVFTKKWVIGQSESHHFSELADQTTEWLYFEYHPVSNPIPSFPLAEICGRSILRLNRRLVPAGFLQLFWLQKRGTPPGLVPRPLSASELGQPYCEQGPAVTFVVVRDRAIVEVLPVVPAPIDGLIAARIERGHTPVLINFARMSAHIAYFVEHPIVYSLDRTGDAYSAIDRFVGAWPQRETRFPHMIFKDFIDPQAQWEDMTRKTAFLKDPSHPIAVLFYSVDP
jgi:hypothetical protein